MAQHLPSALAHPIHRVNLFLAICALFIGLLAFVAIMVAVTDDDDDDE